MEHELLAVRPGLEAPDAGLSAGRDHEELGVHPVEDGGAVALDPGPCSVDLLPEPVLLDELLRAAVRVLEGAGLELVGAPARVDRRRDGLEEPPRSVLAALCEERLDVVAPPAPAVVPVLSAEALLFADLAAFAGTAKASSG